MFKKLFGAAFAAGIVAGLLISGIQEFTTTPIILHAEEFEGAGHDHTMVPGFEGYHIVLAHSPADDSDHDHGEEAWGPEDGLERMVYTFGSNITLAIAFALMLAAAFAVYGREVDGRTGVLWGLGGFAMFTLGPNLGLPPEVPGSMAAELGARQMWWLGCAAATGIGLALLVFGRKLAFTVLGLLLIAAPHIIGAPQPDSIGGGVPPELAGHFAAASIVVAAIFWAMLGWLTGTFYKRFDATA